MSLVPPAPGLKRGLNLPLLVLYGLGTTIGAGIYALTGAVAGSAGMGAPWSFLLASGIAAFTALSFAEMCSRFPLSAGEAVYVREGLGLPALATLVGLLVASAGCVSSATIVNAFVGYLNELIEAPPALTVIPAVALLALIAAWGIGESVTLAGIFTLLEIGGLVVVIWVARDGFESLPARLPELVPGTGSGPPWPGVLSASLLAFYAFLGFEDMVNVAEEVKGVERTMPRGILLTLAVTTLLYVLLALAVVLKVPPAELAAHPAPLALVYERSTGEPATVVSLIAIFAVMNGALIQMIMASRVIFGLATQGALPQTLARVQPRTKTPVRATVLVALAITGLTLWFPLARLAEVTSVLTLMVFALVNLALWRLKARPGPAWGGWRIPRAVPALGFLISLGFVVYGVAGWV
jgi:APA family basic amino acid/polyamine antiporter